MIRAALIALCTCHALPLAAELTTAGDSGFTVSHRLETPVEPSQVYRVLTEHVDEWWNPEHSWSGVAKNLYVRAEPGGCFCERLSDGGFVEHLRIVYLAPGKEIRFDGALGPLQSMAVVGRMIWKVEKADHGSSVSFTYHVFGHPDGGLSGIAPAVDGVIGEQLQRLGDRLASAGSGN